MFRDTNDMAGEFAASAPDSLDQFKVKAPDPDQGLRNFKANFEYHLNQALPEEFDALSRWAKGEISIQSIDAEAVHLQFEIVGQGGAPSREQIAHMRQLKSDRSALGFFEGAQGRAWLSEDMTRPRDEVYLVLDLPLPAGTAKESKASAHNDNRHPLSDERFEMHR